MAARGVHAADRPRLPVGALSPVATYTLRLALWCVVVILAWWAVVAPAQTPPDVFRYQRDYGEGAQGI